MPPSAIATSTIGTAVVATPIAPNSLRPVMKLKGTVMTMTRSAIPPPSRIGAFHPPGSRRATPLYARAALIMSAGGSSHSRFATARSAASRSGVGSGGGSGAEKGAAGRSSSSDSVRMRSAMCAVSSQRRSSPASSSTSPSTRQVSCPSSSSNVKSSGERCPSQSRKVGAKSSRSHPSSWSAATWTAHVRLTASLSNSVPRQSASKPSVPSV